MGGDGGSNGGLRPGVAWIADTSDGLNPKRQRGFGQMSERIETPTLNDMQAKQGAVVSKFLTFLNRKKSLMIELYERAFYAKRPGWDQVANFIYNDLCPSEDLRISLEDVQFHPVKMIIFIKMKTEDSRNKLVAKLQSPGGVMWTEYGVFVRGHCLDASVKVIRLLGVSPESDAEDIRKTFMEVGIGDVIDIRKGLLDPKRLPGVTNGSWLARVKILDPNKPIPPYIIRREEGELWSLNFEGRRFVCWKCGSPDHIGDKCRAQEKTFEEVFGESSDSCSTPSWAAIVKGHSGFGAEVIAKRDEYEKKIREKNEVIASEKRAQEEKRNLAENAVRQAITAAFENAAHSGSEREGASNEMNDEDDVLLSKLIGDASVSEVSNVSLDKSASKEVDEVTADQLDSVEAQLASLHGCKEDGEFDSIVRGLLGGL